MHSLNVRDERYVCDFLDMYDSPNVFSSNVCRALANYTRNDDVIDTHLLGGLVPTRVVYKIEHWAERNAVMYVMVWGNILLRVNGTISNVSSDMNSITI